MQPFLLWDATLYHWINQVLVCSVLDWFMPVVTNVHNWMPVYVIGLLLLSWKGGMRGRRCTVLLLLCVLISDPLNSRVIKELVKRPRPFVSESSARVLCSAGGPSFPSSHATNNFAAALILSSYFPRRRRWWYAIAAIVAYSRVYVGVHFPSDVLAGAIEGSLIAWLLLELDARVLSRWHPKTMNNRDSITQVSN